MALPKSLQEARRKEHSQTITIFWPEIPALFSAKP